jgi:hypothetical protein
MYVPSAVGDAASGHVDHVAVTEGGMRSDSVVGDST